MAQAATNVLGVGQFATASEIGVPAVPVASAVASSKALASNPVLGLLTRVLSVFGLNAPTAPRYPFGPLAWGLFRRIETCFGDVPVAGAPTVGTADPITGVVTGSLNVSVPAGLPLTYTVLGSPVGGSVEVESDGTFIYTPNSFGTNTFTVTASDGLAATNQTVTVSIPASTDLAGVIATIGVGYYPVDVAVTPDGTRTYVTNVRDNTVSVIDTDPQSLYYTVVIATLSVGSGGVAFSPDGTRAYVSNSRSNQVSVIDTATNTVTSKIAVGQAPADISVSPDGSAIWVANRGSESISEIDAATNTVAATVHVGGGGAGRKPSGSAVTPDGRNVYLAITHNIQVAPGMVFVIDAATAAVTARITVGMEPYGVVFSPDGLRAYVGHYRGVSVIDTDPTSTAYNSVIAVIGDSDSPGVGVSPDGSVLWVSSTRNTSVLKINAATGSVISEVGVRSDPSGLAVSSDGKYVYVANSYSDTVSVISTGATG